MNFVLQQGDIRFKWNSSMCIEEIAHYHFEQIQMPHMELKIENEYLSIWCKIFKESLMRLFDMSVYTVDSRNEKHDKTRCHVNLFLIHYLSIVKLFN